MSESVDTSLREASESAGTSIAPTPIASSAAIGKLDPRVVLARGLSAFDAVELRRSLGLPAEAEDKLVARELVIAAAKAASSSLTRDNLARRPGREDKDPSRIMPQRNSFVMRMPVTAAAGLSVSRLSDLRTLLAMIRGGALAQRRAAVLRVGELLSSDADIGSDLRKQSIAMLVQLRRLPLAHEASQVLSTLSGAEGRAERAERKVWNELCARVQASIVAYWDGDEGDDPIAALSGEERGQLFARVRDLPDLIVRHLAALIENALDDADRSHVRMLLTAAEHAGDSRLVPALRSVIESQDAELFAPAVRVLCRIEDTRVHGVLREAYERAARAQDRLLLAGALGAVGDARGIDYARQVLAGTDPALYEPALEALSHLGGADDVSRIAEFLDRDEEPLVRAAVAALAQAADNRGLSLLARVRERAKSSALRAEIEDAEAAIAARMELHGEEAPPQSSVSTTLNTTKLAAIARTRDPAAVRARSRFNYTLANLWLLIGMRERAVARFDAAAVLRPGWVLPVLRTALLFGRRAETARAMTSFRRAIEIDRAHIEAQPAAITAMAQTFLRRAETVEREGRTDIAHGLVEEILSYDLRLAAPSVRFALRELKEAQDMRVS